MTLTDWKPAIRNHAENKLGLPSGSMRALRLYILRKSAQYQFNCIP